MIYFISALFLNKRFSACRSFNRFPYVPSRHDSFENRCREVCAIQVHGLAKRLKQTGMRRVVIGVSGGLDSSHALLVCARTMDVLGFPRADILAYTMPGFGTSARTLKHARRLIRAIDCTSCEIDIRPSCNQMLA